MRGNKRYSENYCLLLGNYFEHDGFWPGVMSQLLTKVKTLNTDNVNIVCRLTRLTEDPRLNMVTHKLLIDFVIRISYIKTRCVILESFTVRPDVLFC